VRGASARSLGLDPSEIGSPPREHEPRDAGYAEEPSLAGIAARARPATARAPFDAEREGALADPGTALFDAERDAPAARAA
jgi:hypothetical protein